MGLGGEGHNFLTALQNFSSNCSVRMEASRARLLTRMGGWWWWWWVGGLQHFSVSPRPPWFWGSGLKGSGLRVWGQGSTINHILSHMKLNGVSLPLPMQNLLIQLQVYVGSVY